jgi:hypothetical protein
MRTAYRTHRRPLLASLSSVVMLCCAQPALAQAVNKCTVGGRVVYQASPCAIEARPAIATPAATTAAATTTATAATDALASNANPSAAPKKKTLADVLRERDGAAPAQPTSREFQQDGANVLRSRMGAV